MANAYTQGVKDGSVTTLAEFALRLANVPPDWQQAQPAEFWHRALEEERQALRRLERLTPEQARQEYEDQFAKRVAEWEQYQEQKRAVVARYQRMIELVDAWQPPTIEHVEFKTTMINQLVEGRDYDGRGLMPEPTRDPASYIVWHLDRLKHQREAVARAAARWEQEQREVDTRNLWVLQLKESLK